MARCVAAVVVVLLATAAPPRAGGADPTVQLLPAAGLLDAPLRVVAKGLEPHSRVVVKLSTRDVRGRRWQATASATADRNGRAQLDAARLLPALQPANPAVSPLTASLVPPGSGLQLRVDVLVRARVVASASVKRLLVSSQVSTRALTLRRDRLVGRYSRSSRRERAPAVLMLGGSEGALGSHHLDAALLAARGYHALQLAYFGIGGLPRELRRIPLEYFEAALRWLARQPGVDAGRIFVVGGSRGAELALLLGTRFPSLVYAVAAYAPSSVVVSAPDGISPPWTHRGKPVPYARYSEWQDPRSARTRAAVIPVEAIRGPILLLAGDADFVWPAGYFTRAVADRLRQDGKRDFASLVYSDAGHGVASATPYLPRGTIFAGEGAGGDPEAAARARTRAWFVLLRLLERADR